MTDVNQYLSPTIVIPSALEITGITNSFPMVVSVALQEENQYNTYQLGQQVKLNVPIEYGMFQADGLTARVLSNLNNEITVDVDSRQFDVFTTSDIEGLSPASLSPDGARNLEFSNLTRLVPFQSLNNRGN